MRLLLFTVLLCTTAVRAQLSFEPDIDLGTIESTYKIKGDLILKNIGSTNISLLRADAETGILVHASKLVLQPGDTSLLTILYSPKSKGAFTKKIALVSSDRGEPYPIRLSGNLLNFKTDDKQACYYFGSKKSRNTMVDPADVALEDKKVKRDASNRMPDNIENPPPPPVAEPKAQKTENNTASKTITGLGEEYKPNNIVFLVDVSSSMRDSLKLPIMKRALHYLVDQIRTTDRITFITYADTIKVLTEAANAEQVKELHLAIDRLKAKGMTKGKKAIFFSQAITQKNYIPGGNNQIIIATDGQFKFEKDDEKLWISNQGNKPVILSTLAFGEDKKSLSNLKGIAKKGKGSFIHMRKGENTNEKLMNEIKDRSKK